MFVSPFSPFTAAHRPSFFPETLRCTLLFLLGGIIVAPPAHLRACMTDDDTCYDKSSHSYVDDNGCIVTSWEQQDYHWSTQLHEWVNAGGPTSWDDPPNCDTCDGVAPAPTFDSTCYLPNEGSNPFTPHDGNAKRGVVDFEMVGAAEGKLSFIRHHNTVPRHTDPTLGNAGNWRHNWLFTLDEYMPAGSAKPWRDVIYPSGVRRVFRPQADGTYAPLGRYSDKLVETVGGHIDVTTPDGSVLHFERGTRWNGFAFDMTKLTDKHGLVTILEYKDHAVVKVTEPAGRSLILEYARAIPFDWGRWKGLGTIDHAPAAAQWVEIDVPADLQTQKFRSYGCLAAWTARWL